MSALLQSRQESNSLRDELESAAVAHNNELARLHEQIETTDAQLRTVMSKNQDLKLELDMLPSLTEWTRVREKLKQTQTQNAELRSR